MTRQEVRAAFRISVSARPEQATLEGTCGMCRTRSVSPPSAREVLLHSRWTSLATVRTSRLKENRAGLSHRYGYAGHRRSRLGGSVSKKGTLPEIFRIEYLRTGCGTNLLPYTGSRSRPGRDIRRHFFSLDRAATDNCGLSVIDTGGTKNSKFSVYRPGARSGGLTAHGAVRGFQVGENLGRPAQQRRGPPHRRVYAPC